MFCFFFQAEDGIRDYKVTGVPDVCSSDLDLRLQGRSRSLGGRGRLACASAGAQLGRCPASACPGFLLRMNAQGGLLKTHTRERRPPGVCGIPPRYQAALRAGTGFPAISLPSWVKRLWISDVTVANSSARARSLSTN